MGHYAGEMEGPPDQPSVATLREREAARKSQREFLWNLYTKRRFQGESVRDSELLACPQCSATVMYQDMVGHENWHSSLIRQMEDVARWTAPGLIG